MEPTIPITSKRILVVEPNSQIRRVITQILQIENYRTIQASSGQEALNILHSTIPDLILSELNLVDMDGRSFFETLRKNHRLSAIPVVFITSGASRENILAIREIGVEDQVAKPIIPGELVRTINGRLLRSAEVKAAHIEQAYLETVQVLANAIEGRDHYTRGHVERVTTYALYLAEELRWPAENMRFLEFGARLHDIGKIIIPDHILNKPDGLHPMEWTLMRKHPVAGGQIIQKISHLQPALPYILHHHEKWDGSGYPQGLKGREIPLGARLLALADVYDAMTTSRPYRPALSPEEVLKFLQAETGKHFDPDLVPTFIRVIKNAAPLPEQVMELH